MHYPSEVFVQIYFKAIGSAAQSGLFLDYGCGSGNNSEFIARRGWTVAGADISTQALKVQSKRLAELGFTSKQQLIDTSSPLEGQLETYANVLCWDCLCYNTLEKAKQDAAVLCGAIEPGGMLFINMPTLRHDFATTGKLLSDGSYQNQRKGTQQEGAIMAIPKDLENLISWFPDLVVVQKGFFTFDFNGFKEFMIFIGKKPKRS